MKRLLALFSFASLACGSPDGSQADSSTGGVSSVPATGGVSSVPATGGASQVSATGGSASVPTTGGSSAEGGAQTDTPNPLGRYRCKAPQGVSASPQTIQEAVELINALPKPTTVACFVESLARPLTINATNSQFSAQPAGSTASPRLFIKFGQLWLSVVIDGDATNLIEFGYLIPNTFRSIKAEVELPIEAPLAQNAPFDRLMFSDIGTICRLCHADEQREEVAGIGNVFSSKALKPRPETLVSIDSLAVDARNCDWQSEPHRCEMLAAVFGGGTVMYGAFPDEMQTFF